MFLSRRPDVRTLNRFLDRQNTQPFSYPEVGSTHGPSLAGYNVDHNRIWLGKGREIFERATQAVKEWQMFGMDWVEVFPRNAPIASGSIVAILARHVGFWSLNASRIVYVLDDHNGLERFGFAYGTLLDHVERGEERFTVEYNPADDSVWYDLLAFSRPRHFLAWVGYPLSRRLQRQFAKDSLKAMERAVEYESSDS